MQDVTFDKFEWNKSKVILCFKISTKKTRSSLRHRYADDAAHYEWMMAWEYLKLEETNVKEEKRKKDQKWNHLCITRCRFHRLGKGSPHEKALAQRSQMSCSFFEYYFEYLLRTQTKAEKVYFLLLLMMRCLNSNIIRSIA